MNSYEKIKDYRKEKLHKIQFDVQLWEYEIIKAYCNRHNIKLTSWIKSLIRKEIANENNKNND
jgi:hypothetical protein